MQMNLQLLPVQNFVDLFGVTVAPEDDKSDRNQEDQPDGKACFCLPLLLLTMMFTPIGFELRARILLSTFA